LWLAIVMPTLPKYEVYELSAFFATTVTSPEKIDWRLGSSDSPDVAVDFSRAAFKLAVSLSSKASLFRPISSLELGALPWIVNPGLWTAG